jgi:hypothetical protein
LHIAGCTLISGIEKPAYFPPWPPYIIYGL